jgi:hypothetical protein
LALVLNTLIEDGKVKEGIDDYLSSGRDLNHNEIKLLEMVSGYWACNRVLLGPLEGYFETVREETLDRILKGKSSNENLRNILKMFEGEDANGQLELVPLANYLYHEWYDGLYRLGRGARYGQKV